MIPDHDHDSKHMVMFADVILIMLVFPCLTFDPDDWQAFVAPDFSFRGIDPDTWPSTVVHARKAYLH